MRSKALLLAAAAALIAGMTATTFADDGERLFKTISSAPGQVGSPEPEGEHAFVQLMNFYVPAQSSDGTVLTEGIDYIDADGTLRKTELNAKPLVSFFIYGPVIAFDEPSTSGFPGHGRRDAFAAVSLDDGVSWKRTNLSESADKSSFTTTTFIQDPAVPAPEFEVTSATPIVTAAAYLPRRSTLTVSGSDAPRRSTVEIRNAITKEVIGTVTARAAGTFTFRTTIDATAVPCSVQAGFTATNTWGPYLNVVGAPADCVGPDEVTLTNEYPGDVTNGVHAIAGNRVIAAWQSKFCSAGFPAWSAEYPVDIVAPYLGIDTTKDFYLTDLFGVSGSQGSVDYREQEEFAGEYDDIGEVPFNCLWVSRGVLREDPAVPGTTEVVWFKAERLTSGRRDLNRIEASCVTGAGCAVTWQEDPEGLRPGEGEGAGTGWAGATTNSQTDVWYSFVRWEDFDIVDNNGAFEPLGDLILGTNRPQPAVPMMVAARLSNNARCQVGETDINYCNPVTAAPYGIKNQCVATTEIPLGPQGTLQAVCVVDSNGSDVGDPGDMPNVANTASSRPRLSLQPRDSDGDGLTDDAWVMVFAEEDKGLGRFGFANDVAWDFNIETTAVESCGDPDVNKDDNCIEADIGKNVWWFSFAMGTPKTSVASYGGADTAAAGVEFSLLNNVAVQGNILNQPEVNWRTGTFFPPMSTLNMWDFSASETDYNYLIFNTEIARRSSMMAQSLGKALSGDSGLVALPLWKQGTVNQGGPADIMGRRFVVSTGVTPPDECSIEVDPEAPVVTAASYVVTSTGIPQIRVTVTGFDGLTTTRLRLRNAVSEDLYGYARSVNETGTSVTYAVNVREDLWGPIPCAIQAADWDVPAPTFGGWVAVAAAPSCEPEIPPECLTDGDTSMDVMADATPIDQATMNPYDFANMACEYTDDAGNVVPGVKLFTDGSNPYYPKGLCMAPAINLSGRTPFECDAGNSGADGICPGESETFTCTENPGYGQLCVAGDLVNDDPENTQVFDKLLSWYECPGWNGADVSVGGPDAIPDTCGLEPISAKLGSNLNDQSWYMPLEISKGHRGFLDGDFVQMLYAWSPNYKDNSVGRDRYELYVRRSFDGGATWTTTPTSFTGTDGIAVTGAGTTTCETWRDGATSADDSHVCTAYAAGVDEQSRNVSQLTSNRFTILDPRYTPTGTNLGVAMPSVPFDGADDWLLFTPVAPTDLRNASRYFVVFETGDNTTTLLGEAEPLDLNYMRAELFGDHYTVWAELDTGFGGGIDDCFPNNPHGDTDYDWAATTGFCNESDGLEAKQDDRSEEASVTASAYGDFLYGVWGQFTLDDAGEFVEGDAVFRRVWYLDDYIPSDAWLPGQGQTQ